MNEYWEELSGLVRNLLNATFKTNPYLERGILTGITRVSREGSAAIKSDFEALMKGQELEKKIDEQIVFSQLLSDEDAVWSLLLAAGYLKANGHYMDVFTYEESYRLSITNREVHLIFRNMVRGWFAGNKTVYNAFVRAMLEDDLKAMNAYMNQVALTGFSFFDSGKSPSGNGEPERFYHGFVLGLVVELAGRYVITSNRESGFGRYDVMLEPLRNEDAVIMEFKVREPAEEKSLSDTAERAILQIRQKKYAAALMDRGIPEERIRCYGFAFEGKRVLIGKDTFELS